MREAARLWRDVKSRAGPAARRFEGAYGRCEIQPHLVLDSHLSRPEPPTGSAEHRAGLTLRATDLLYVSSDAFDTGETHWSRRFPLEPEYPWVSREKLSGSALNICFEAQMKKPGHKEHNTQDITASWTPACQERKPHQKWH